MPLRRLLYLYSVSAQFYLMDVASLFGGGPSFPSGAAPPALPQAEDDPPQSAASLFGGMQDEPHAVPSSLQRADPEVREMPDDLFGGGGGGYGGGGAGSFFGASAGGQAFGAPAVAARVVAAPAAAMPPVGGIPDGLFGGEGNDGCGAFAFRATGLSSTDKKYGDGRGMPSAVGFEGTWSISPGKHILGARPANGDTAFGQGNHQEASPPRSKTSEVLDAPPSDLFGGPPPEAFSAHFSGDRRQYSAADEVFGQPLEPQASRIPASPPLHAPSMATVSVKDGKLDSYLNQRAPSMPRSTPGSSASPPRELEPPPTSVFGAPPLPGDAGYGVPTSQTFGVPPPPSSSVGPPADLFGAPPSSVSPGAGTALPPGSPPLRASLGSPPTAHHAIGAPSDDGFTISPPFCSGDGRRSHTPNSSHQRTAKSVPANSAEVPRSGGENDVGRSDGARSHKSSVADRPRGWSSNSGPSPSPAPLPPPPPPPPASCAGLGFATADALGAGLDSMFGAPLPNTNGAVALPTSYFGDISKDSSGSNEDQWRGGQCDGGSVVYGVRTRTPPGAADVFASPPSEGLDGGTQTGQVPFESSEYSTLRATGVHGPSATHEFESANAFGAPPAWPGGQLGTSRVPETRPLGAEAEADGAFGDSAADESSSPWWQTDTCDTEQTHSQVHPVTEVTGFGDIQPQEQRQAVSTRAGDLGAPPADLFEPPPPPRQVAAEEVSSAVPKPNSSRSSPATHDANPPGDEAATKAGTEAYATGAGGMSGVGEVASLYVCARTKGMESPGWEGKPSPPLNLGEFGAPPRDTLRTATTDPSGIVGVKGGHADGTRGFNEWGTHAAAEAPAPDSAEDMNRSLAPSATIPATPSSPSRLLGSRSSSWRGHVETDDIPLESAPADDEATKPPSTDPDASPSSPPRLCGSHSSSCRADSATDDAPVEPVAAHEDTTKQPSTDLGAPPSLPPRLFGSHSSSWCAENATGYVPLASAAAHKDTTKPPSTDLDAPLSLPPRLLGSHSSSGHVDGAPHDAPLEPVAADEDIAKPLPTDLDPPPSSPSRLFGSRSSSWQVGANSADAKSSAQVEGIFGNGQASGAGPPEPAFASGEEMEAPLGGLPSPRKPMSPPTSQALKRFATPSEVQIDAAVSEGLEPSATSAQDGLADGGGKPTFGAFRSSFRDIPEASEVGHLGLFCADSYRKEEEAIGEETSGPGSQGTTAVPEDPAGSYLNEVAGESSELFSRTRLSSCNTPDAPWGSGERLFHADSYGRDREAKAEEGAEATVEGGAAVRPESCLSTPFGARSSGSGASVGEHEGFTSTTSETHSVASSPTPGGTLPTTAEESSAGSLEFRPIHEADPPVAPFSGVLESQREEDAANEDMSSLGAVQSDQPEPQEVAADGNYSLDADHSADVTDGSSGVADRSLGVVRNDSWRNDQSQSGETENALLDPRSGEGDAPLVEEDIHKGDAIVPPTYALQGAHGERPVRVPPPASPVRALAEDEQKPEVADDEDKAGVSTAPADGDGWGDEDWGDDEVNVGGEGTVGDEQGVALEEERDGIVAVDVPSEGVIRPEANCLFGGFDNRERSASACWVDVGVKDGEEDSEREKQSYSTENNASDDSEDDNGLSIAETTASDFFAVRTLDFFVSQEVAYPPSK